MATQYISAASWSHAITVAADGDQVFLPQTVAALMGVGVATTSGTITVFSTLGTPEQIQADTCTWTAVSLTSGEGTITMPVSGVKVTGAGGAAGKVVFIQ